MKNILETLSHKANNIEEICCGIGNNVEYFNKRGNKENLIKEIDLELECFIEAFNKLKE